MADNSSGGSTPWIAFIGGIILVALIAFGIYAYSGGGMSRPDAPQQIEIEAPTINPPDIEAPKIEAPQIDAPELPPAPTPEPAPASAP